MIERTEGKIGALAAGLFALGMNYAQAEEDSAWKHQASLGWRSQYVLGDFGAPVAGSSIRYTARATHVSGFYADLWGNEALEPTKKGNQTNEQDYSGGIETQCVGGVICDFGLSYYRIEDRDNRLDIIHPYVNFLKTFDSVLGQTTAQVGQNANFFPNTNIDPIYTTSIGVYHRFPKVLGVTPELNASAHRNFGGNNGDRYNLRAGGGFSLALTPNIDLYAGVEGNFPDNIEETVVYRAGVSFAF